jgi:hypothetical protein
MLSEEKIALDFGWTHAASIYLKLSGAPYTYLLSFE